MRRSSGWFWGAIAIALAAAGFVVPFWPLSVLGVVFAALLGQWVIAVLVAVLLDLAWGAPTGVLHILYFPFTELALVCVGLRVWSKRYLLDRSVQEKI